MVAPDLGRVRCVCLPRIARPKPVRRRVPVLVYRGNLFGDVVLKNTALRVRELLRSSDSAARFGGEEFVLVLPETDAVAAKKVAERCHQMIFKEQIMHAKSQVSQVLTISLGVGTIIPSAENESLAFIHEVDRLLYLAKQKGRNRIVSSTG